MHKLAMDAQPLLLELADTNASVAGLRLDAASDVEVVLQGVTPVGARLVAHSLQLDGLHVGPGHDDARSQDAASAGYDHSHVPHAPAK